MIILGKKHIFNDTELAYMQAINGDLTWLSVSQSDIETLKASINEVIQKHGPQTIILNTRENPSNAFLTYLTHLELQGNLFITTAHFMERHLSKCYIPHDNFCFMFDLFIFRRINIS